MPSEEREGKSNTVHGMMSEKCRRITVIEGRKSQHLEGKGGFGKFLVCFYFCMETTKVCWKATGTNR